MAESTESSVAAWRWPWWSYAVAAALVTLASILVTWPIAAGVMPRSADHQVHMARAQLWAQTLASGHGRGWSDAWAFGTPIGELYPPLADALVLTVKGLSLGLASWPTAYALAFFVAFTIQGWAMLRAGRALGMGPIPGLVAGLLVLLDPGFYREGGWMYTVSFGVWPQVLANALCWLAFAETALACRPRSDEDPTRLSPTRHLALAGLWLGLALLAHPIVLPMAVLGLPTLALTLAVERHEDGYLRGLWPTAARAGFVLIAGVGIASWWLLPMLQHRAWMASYGWLHEPLERLVEMARRGEWTYRMPRAIGWIAGLGLLGALVPSVASGPSSSTTQAFGRRWWRFIAAFALGMWLASASDLYWGLRLDLLSEGFTHLQYQRFLIAAKPGFFLLVGAVFGQLVTWAIRSRDRLPIVFASGALTLGLAVFGAQDLRTAMIEYDVGKPEVERFPDDPRLVADYEALVDWANELPEAERGRFAFMDSRNTHWFMDFTVRTGLPLYKAGFTPGDNFVHKPESRTSSVLDHAGVRYVVSRSPRRVRDETLVKTFGGLRIYARPPDITPYPVHVRGQGSATVVEGSIAEGHVVAKVEGVASDDLVVFSIAGFPRWRAFVGDEPVEWLEVPVVGSAEPIATDVRASGALRGGKADGDDGTEPTLVGIPIAQDADVRLEYVARTGRDVFAFVVSLLTLAGLVTLGWRDPSTTIENLDTKLRRVSPAWSAVLVAVLVALLATRWVTHGRAEQHTLHAQAQRGEAKLTGPARAGPLKTDMLIRPAVVVTGRNTATIELPVDALPERLQGWFALDDDWAKASRQGDRHLRIAVDGDPTPLVDRPVRHRPGRVDLDLDLAERAGTPGVLRIEVTGEGKRPPPFGLDLDL